MGLDMATKTDVPAVAKNRTSFIRTVTLALNIHQHADTSTTQVLRRVTGKNIFAQVTEQKSFRKQQNGTQQPSSLHRRYSELALFYCPMYL
jgi:hypothetical protein